MSETKGEYKICKNNQLPWEMIKEDMTRFRNETIKCNEKNTNAVIMGRKTFESMPRALPKRKNIILTRNETYEAKNALVAHSIEEALDLTGDDPTPFIIGGGEIYSLFFHNQYVSSCDLRDGL